MLAETTQQATVLFVDDETVTLRQFTRAFGKKFNVLTACNTADAGVILDKCDQDISVLVSDERMPGEPGISFLKRVKKDHPDIVRILTTGYSDMQNIQDSVNSAEVFRYIPKPWNLATLGDDLAAAVSLFNEKKQLREQVSGFKQALVEQRIGMALLDTLRTEGLEQIIDQFFLRMIVVEDYSIHLTHRLFSEGKDGHWYEYTPSAQPNGVVEEQRSGLESAVLSSVLRDQRETIFYGEAAPEYLGSFQRHPVSAAVPLFTDDKLAGVILLGKPLKAEQYSADDIRLLNWFGREVAGVLETWITHTEMQSKLNEAENRLSIVSQFNEYNHDVKTPLSNIEALILAGEAFTEEERKTKILDQVERGNALVSTMVNVLKEQHFKTKSLFDLNQLADEVIQSFPTQVKNVRTSFSELPASYAYEEELKIVLLNLLSNAFQAKDKDCPDVLVSTHYDSARDLVICKVADNGCGIAPERLDVLWAKPGSNRKHLGGSGVGLRVVKRIIEDHKGTISVTSTLGEGTEFTLTLPVVSL
ncbi:MAG: response regulator [Kordiimonadaceae bacterium]|nr:response regulator [Kordiimonadaceae bacterium]